MWLMVKDAEVPSALVSKTEECMELKDRHKAEVLYSETLIERIELKDARIKELEQQVERLKKSLQSWKESNR